MFMYQQEKFYNLIATLSKVTSHVSNEERKYLTEAKQMLDAGAAFEVVIDRLDRALKALDFGRIQAGGLTPEVKTLFESLRSVYGELIQNNDVHIIGPGGGSHGDRQYKDFIWLLLAIIIPMIIIVYVVSPRLQNDMYQKQLIAGWLFLVMISLICSSRRQK